MEKIIYAKIEYNIENGMVGAKFPVDIDYSNNSDYIKMIELQNFYEATEEEYKLAISKQCIINDNVLMEYILPHSQALINCGDNAKVKITAMRKERQYTPITYKDITYIATEKARQNCINSYIIAKSTSQKTILWLDINNNPISLQLVDMLGIIESLRDRDSSLYHAEASAIKQIEKCNTIDEINAIVENF